MKFSKEIQLIHERDILKRVIESPTGFISCNTIHASDFIDEQAAWRLINKYRLESFALTKAEYKVRLPLNRRRYYLTIAYYKLVKYCPAFLLPYVEWLVGILFVLIALSPVISIFI